MRRAQYCIGPIALGPQFGKRRNPVVTLDQRRSRTDLRDEALVQLPHRGIIRRFRA
jgi:hypothetical protein